ncbi:MAG: hypothetical protein RDU24_02530 [Humidesulfovibrio sp.]|uniref:hypothetical protein n=1 Tax=Humidesulfovibrio sp. TaxID=2910988 RepID=UPI0027EFFE8A|nr:hypothetical protein [Humidesulfovibrio sp.]MDQ7834234.1 hypothetical protein [Humidesulfovibrio sp.]
MKDAWYVVDIYCALALWGVIRAAIKSGWHSGLFAITAAVTVAVLLLTWRTYRGSRLASRVLATYIAINVGLNSYSIVIDPHPFEVFDVYMLGVNVFLFVGAIKLWRIKELPTRFTDPPTEEQAHH